METEIVKTEDPNIVVEVTTSTREINIEELVNQKMKYEETNVELHAKIDNLKILSVGLSDELILLIDKEIALLTLYIDGNMIELNRLNNILLNLN